MFVEPEASWKSHRVHYRAQQRRMRRGFQSKIDPTQTVEVIYRIAMDNERREFRSHLGTATSFKVGLFACFLS